MKKFFCVIPLQKEGQLKSYHYAAVGNQKLEMAGETCFPIITAMNGYLEQDEQFCVIAAVPDNDDGRRNLSLFETEVQRVAADTGAVCTAIERVAVPEDERVSVHAETFSNLIDFVEDHDELFACITFGTKPLSEAVRMAVQYAYRVKKNTSITCIVYGQVKRTGTVWQGSVYDETALIQLDEVVRVLAESRVEKPKQAIDSILSL